jgi:glycosyltransferase involved in cell wall biosynthesis
MLAFLGSRNVKILFLHGHNFKDFYNKKTEVRWGKFPWLYFWLENKLLPLFNHIYTVREDAAHYYKTKYPTKAHDISFLPTWVDDTIFYSIEEGQRRALCEKLTQEKGIPASSKMFLFVGRYEGQKDPLRLLDAFRQVKTQNSNAVLILIGEGSLKAKMQQYVQDHNLSAAVRFLPPMAQQDIAQWMNVADVLCLSSAFEGMPLVVIEALYCGLPVVSTAVGETARLLGNLQGGRLVTDESAEAFAKQMIDLIENPPTREVCKKQAEPFTARQILAPVYQYHRQMSHIANT